MKSAWLLVGAAGLAAWFFWKPKVDFEGMLPDEPDQMVPHLDANEHQLGDFAAWFSTLEQSNLFGPRYPDFYQDGKGFAFQVPRQDVSEPVRYEFYKPTWKVFFRTA